MRTDERVRSMCLHHLCVGDLPVSTHIIDLMMNAQYSGLDFKYKACFNRPYLHACANFLNGSWSRPYFSPAIILPKNRPGYEANGVVIYQHTTCVIPCECLLQSVESVLMLWTSVYFGMTVLQVP